jgi:signal transduction histidine kinase
VVRVDDDGVGPPGPDAPTSGGLGLGNLSRRASRRGGTFSLSARPGGGTTAEWNVPNPA